MPQFAGLELLSRWITIEAERVLYVDRGRDVILCDRGHKGPVTLVLKISDDEHARNAFNAPPNNGPHHGQ